MIRGRVVAAITAIGDDAGKIDADLRLDLRNDGGQRVAVVRIAGQRLGVSDELAALGMMQRRGDGNLDAELIRAMRLTFANAFDLGRMQRINLRPALVLTLLAHPPRQ